MVFIGYLSGGYTNTRKRFKAMYTHPQSVAKYRNTSPLVLIGEGRYKKFTERDLNNEKSGIIIIRDIQGFSRRFC